MKRTNRSLWALACLVALTASAALADFRLEKTLEFPSGGVLDLTTDSGRVTVRGTARNDLRVVVTSERDDLADDYDFRFEEHSGGVEIRVKKKGSWVRRWFQWKDAPQFAIELPRDANLEIDTAGGRIDVSDIDGEARVDTSGGRIKLASVAGNVVATTSGGSIAATELGADALLETSGGSIGVEGVAGSVVADTSGGSITIRDAAGRVEADTSGGSVTAYFTRGNREGGSLSSSGGRITAYVDASAALDIDASSSGGGVEVDLPITVRGKISRSSIRGTLNGGGPLLRLHTSGGGVRVKAL